MISIGKVSNFARSHTNKGHSIIFSRVSPCQRQVVNEKSRMHTVFYLYQC